MSDAEARRPRVGFIAAAIVVAAIVVAGVVVVVGVLAGAPAGEPTPTGTGTNDAVSEGDRSVCGLEAFEAESSLTSAPDNEWELVGTVAAPTSPSVGPGVVDDDGFRSCFAHTAEGALFAAVNYFALSSDAKYKDRIAELFAPGPGRDAAIEAARDAADPSNARIQVAGFKVNSYSAASAVIDVAWSVTTEGGQLVSLPLSVVWVDGDWKIELLDNGQLRFTSATLQSLGGYIVWAGV